MPSIPDQIKALPRVHEWFEAAVERQDIKGLLAFEVILFAAEFNGHLAQQAGVLVPGLHRNLVTLATHLRPDLETEFATLNNLLKSDMGEIL